MINVVLLGGPCNGVRVDLIAAPVWIKIGENGPTYTRVDDPTTGEFLGGYVAELMPT